ncbi:hypothetical protein RCL_jg4316.t1 [Rhizophagus clarus]|uniref:Uncharacterized protein n=1 Tax=Rhizophagus clarus TaxID=94130 RepID=A0A8H3KVW0_9GLOM|nr:hypothetical protein RCL_jg4316.t1 [Rhizophagus clarus]
MVTQEIFDRSLPMTNLYKGHARDPYPPLSGSSAKLLGSWYEPTWLKFNADLLAGQIEPMFSIPPYGLIGESVFYEILFFFSFSFSFCSSSVLRILFLCCGSFLFECQLLETSIG